MPANAKAPKHAPAIYYVCPDIDKPSGGILRLYRHVEILVRNGFRAAILHQTDPFRMSWFESDVPVRYLNSGTHLENTDILVIPEVCHEFIRKSQGITRRRVAIVLNWAYIYLGLKPGESYRQFGIDHVIAGCEYIREFVLTTMQIDGRVVSAGIDTGLFKPAEQKELAIVCAPRKNPNHLHNIECIFRARYSEFAHVPFVRLHEVKHTVVADRLTKSAIYLATGFPEGIARPVLEAMASGCIVVGFHGKGGLEYMRHGENCFVAEDGDVLAAAEQLGTAVKLFPTGGLTSIRQVARRTALRYDNEVEEAAVLGYWRDFLQIF